MNKAMGGGSGGGSGGFSFTNYNKTITLWELFNSYNE